MQAIQDNEVYKQVLSDSLLAISRDFQSLPIYNELRNQIIDYIEAHNGPRV